MPERPNVLLICADQQPWFALGAVDDSFYTPHIDGLAERGTLFSGCHSTHPQCSPARSSLVTGQYPHQTGMHTLFSWGPGDLDTDLPSVGRAFREAGYDTAYFGRWDLGHDNIEDLGWETHNLDVTGTPGQAGRERDEQTLADAVEYIETRSGDAPFFLTVSFNLPHPGYFEDEDFADYYDRSEVPVPRSFGDDLTDKPAFVRERAESLDLTESDVREVNYQVRTMTSRVDALTGHLLEALRQAGVREETAVAYTADHGDMLGGHRLLKKGVLPYDEILRVPLLIDVPGRESVRDEIPDLVSLAGLPGTLLDAAGLDYDAFEGGSFLDTLDRGAQPSDEQVFFEHKYAYWAEHPFRGVRTTDWKYVEYLTGEGEELYDIDHDPDEMENLAGDPEHETTRQRLQAAVRNWWEETGADTEAWIEPID